MILFNIYKAVESGEIYPRFFYKGNEMKEYTNSEISAIIDEHIHSERDRKILKRRFIDGICYEPLAEEFDLSVRQVKNIIYNSESLIFKHI